MKKTFAIFAAVATVLLGSGCTGPGTTPTVPVDEVGLYYKDGPLEGPHFKRVLSPGSGTHFRGVFDRVVKLPAGQRNYIVSGKEGEGDRQGKDIIVAPARGGVNMDFEVAVYFRLNTATDDIPKQSGGTLRQFWESIGKKYDADTDGGWDNMLNDNFRKIIETSMRQNVFKFTVDELFANSEGEASGKDDAIKKIQDEIAGALRDNINNTLGGRFFCGPTVPPGVVVDDPACPPFRFIINSAVPSNGDVVKSFAAQRVAANEVITAEQRALAKKAEADGIAAAQNALRNNLTPEYLRLQEIEAQKACAANQSGKCDMTFISGGGVVPTLPVW